MIYSLECSVAATGQRWVGELVVAIGRGLSDGVCRTVGATMVLPWTWQILHLGGVEVRIEVD